MSKAQRPGSLVMQSIPPSPGMGELSFGAPPSALATICWLGHDGLQMCFIPETFRVNLYMFSVPDGRRQKNGQLSPRQSFAGSR